MEYLKLLFIEHSALQAIVVLSLISAIGVMLGRVKCCGVSLGTAFIFFVGIMAGHFGLSIDAQMLKYAESFGLVLFVYALGLQVGPGFFSSMRTEGLRLLLPSIGVVLVGTLLSVAVAYACGISIPDMAGILCGATTNTPALGAAQQTLEQMGLSGSGAALSCALTYPLGVVGVILAIIILRRWVVRPSDLTGPDAEHRKNIFLASYRLTNPAAFGKTVHELAAMSHHHFVISRIWRDGRVSIPTSDKQLEEGDVPMVITTPHEAEALRLIFGEQEAKDWNSEDIDWNKIDSQLISQRILVTRPEINGKRLKALRLRNNYGINISRVYRSGVQL
ncbi:MAG: transporter, partial [Alistipes sp.]|nr:transporter [Alistipes sp.]